MAAKLLKVDKNGTKYWVDSVCPSCGGTGVIEYYRYHDNGVCYTCGGTGIYVQKWKEYTEEYSKVLQDRRIKKLIKKAPEENKRFLEENGFNEEGITYAVVGDTYSIKDELKEAGGKFRYGLGWHFNHKVDYPTVELSVDEVCCKSDYGYYFFNEIDDIVKAIKSKLPKEEVVESNYVGEIGNKIEVQVKFERYSLYKVPSFRGYGMDTIYVFIFKDENGNNLVWKTTAYPNIEEGNMYLLKATIKDHGEYNGVKQTYLTRCRTERREEVI